MLLDEAKDLSDFPPGQAGMLCKLYGRLEPELGLAILSLNMHVHSRFFAREEK